MTSNPQQQTTKIERFAIEKMGITLLPVQLMMIRDWANNRISQLNHNKKGDSDE